MYGATVYSLPVIPTLIRWKSYKNNFFFQEIFLFKYLYLSCILLMFTTSLPLQSSWRTGEAPDNWKQTNVAKTFEKGYGKGVEVGSGPRQVIVQSLLAHTSGKMKEKLTGNSLNRFIEGKSCLTNQIAFSYKTSFVGENRKTGLGKVVDITLIQVRLPPFS